MIFRCAAIYGPSRNLLVSVKQGRARRIEKPGLVFSRTHVEDLAQTLEASMRNPKSGEIYNISDDHPAPPTEAVDYACKLLQVTPPPLIPFESAELSEIARGFYLTYAFIFALETGHPETAGLRAQLVAMGRELTMSHP